MAKKTKGCCIVSNDEWMVEEDLRTLMRAKEIRADAKRFAKCQTLAKKKLTEIASVAGAVPGNGNGGA